MSAKQVSFLFPVLNGTLYLAQRVKEPHAGKYGPIGGKHDPIKRYHSEDMSTIIEPNYCPKICLRDKEAQRLGVEPSKAVLKRETLEEIGCEILTQKEGALYYLGSIADTFAKTRFECKLYLGEISGTFKLKPDELRDIKPVSEIIIEELFPLSIMGLAGIKYLHQEVRELLLNEQLKTVHEQIPEIPHKTIIATAEQFSNHNIQGVIRYTSFLQYRSRETRDDPDAILNIIDQWP